MSQASDTNNTPATESKADATAMQAAMADAKPAKGSKSKAATKQAAKTETQQPARRAALQGQRTVVTFATAELMCPNEAVAIKIARLYGLDPVDYHAIRESTEEHLALSAKVLADNLGERFEKPLEMHMQRIVDAFVRSAHGAGMFYDGKTAVARNLTSKIANEDRDEDRDEDRLGVDGTENRAQRACGFAATVGLQAYALLAAAHGAVDAYAYVCGSDWKPYEGMGGQAVSRQAISMQAGAFDRD